ncbi:SPEF2 protein, partial [Chaetorhynchus papuensis]|nr:SPEF2 protein [Chaetorhynchus papuensis]
MSEILCEWLNRDVKLSRRIVPGSFPEAFSTGYLLGELLHKYGLQDDFKEFSKSRLVHMDYRVADAKINNFSRLEPTLHLLGVQFNEDMAQDIMTGQHGAATNLLYELYIALEKKRKAKFTGVAVETMRPAATAKLKSTERKSMNNAGKLVTTEEKAGMLNFFASVFTSQSTLLEWINSRMGTGGQAQEVGPWEHDEICGDQVLHYIGRKRPNEITAGSQTAVTQIQKQPSRPTIKSFEAKRFLKKKREAENVYREIEKFENDMEGLLQTQTFQETTLETIPETKTELLNIYSDDDYVRKIQKRVEEDTFAREQRAKRRRRMLMDQLALHEAQERAYREEQLIYRLMKQSQHERRIAAQLMHVRHEKEVLRQNRIFREKQYEERRQKEFQEALDREAALAKQENIYNEEEIIREREHHKKIAAERAQARYKKHYSICWEMIDQIIDLSAKVGEYRQLTNNRVPLKLMLDWKELFLNGKPIYEQASIQPLPDEPSPEQHVELNKMSLLDEKDYGEYKSMTGEWRPAEENSENKPPLNNNILGHVLRRLMEMFYPPKPKSSPEFPSFPVKGCILGKMFSGKTTCAKFIEKVCNIQVLSVGTLVQEAIEAFLQNELEPQHHMISEEPQHHMILEESQLHMISEEPEISGEQSEVSMFPNSDLGSNSIHCTLPQLSVRAQLGAASQKWLKKGESVPDELLVDILLEAIIQIPPEKGWIVEGFPMTINQAKLFQKSYTGIDIEAKDPISEKVSLAVDPRVPNKPPPTSPAFDVSILLDLSDSMVLKRAANMKYKRKASQAEQSSDQNSDTEILEEKTDLAREQVLHRIAGFLKTWPKLEKWFSVHQNTLVKVNAETEESLVCERVKEIIIEEMMKNQSRSKFPYSYFLELSNKRLLFILHSYQGPAEEIAPEEEVLPVTDEEEVSPVTEEEKVLPVISQPSPSPETPQPIEPGSDEWIYVDEPLPQEIIDFLVHYWEMVEYTYKNTIKTVLRCLRDEQYTVIHYTADIRKNFQDYLKRPHLMQEFVSQWQTDFNSIADDLQDDEETKAELHQRVTNLRDLLWDICDNRREEAEQERMNIMNEEWLPDRRGLAMNHFFTLMQVELDRFQDTKNLLREYYRAMEGKIPAEDTPDFTRIPLLDIIDGEQKEDQEESRRIRLVSWKLPSPPSTESRSSGTSRTRSKDKSSESGVATCRNDESLVIFTWQRAVRAVSDMVTAEIESREMEEEKERQLKPKASKAAQKKQGKAAGKNTKDAKKVPAKSSTKKKEVCFPAGAKASPVPIDPEELRKQELAIKIKQEHFSALKHEEAATKSRLELIKEKALAFLEDLKCKAEEAYNDMEEWLGSTFLAEVSCVEKLVEVARHHIESSSRIQYEMTLEGTDFFINSDVKMVPDPVPDPAPPPEFQRIETSGSNILTISQLTTLHKQFLQLAPKGFIPKKLFIETLSGLVNLNLGINCFPDAWKNLTLPDLQNLACEFTVNSELTDWRRFLLAAAQPWPVPSVTQLLKTLHGFKSVDVTGSGFVTQEQYMQAGLWFNGNEDLSITESCEEPVPLDRLKYLVKFFFSLFADTRKDPALLKYIEMLLYFASHSDPVEGVYRALSIAAGTYIHRKKEASLPCAVKYYRKILENSSSADSSSPSILSNKETLTEDEKEVLNYTGEEIISVTSLLKIFHTGGSQDEDRHRFSPLEKADSYDKHFIKMFQELGAEDLTPIAVELLLKHPFMEDLINTCQEYKLPVSIAFWDQR